TGPADFDHVRMAYRECAFPAQVTPYIDDMPKAFERADLILSRAGASTLAEIAAAGRPSLLVPFPKAADDHQLKNALALARYGASRLLEQSRLTPEELAEVIRQLGRDRKRLQAMSEAARSLSHPDSIDRILKLIGSIASAPRKESGIRSQESGRREQPKEAGGRRQEAGRREL
ncbi:MAG: glycosyltransferase, partial [Acidobacteriota bacterium]